MKIDIVTLFPDMCSVPLGESMMGRAQSAGILDLNVHDLREYGQGKHQRVDDIPYGGGQGMVMKPDPVYEAVEKVRGEGSRVVLMTPQGRRFDQQMAHDYAELDHLVVLSAHYEGVDHRVIEGGLVDDEVSIGDFVLTNGAIAAVVFIDAIVRLIPGVLGDENSAVQESFQNGLLEAPQYTRPPEFRGMKVPDVLLSGHHAQIDAWREEMSKKRTLENRPDLLEDIEEES